MYTSRSNGCIILIAFLLSKGAPLFSCGISNFTENLIAEEFTFSNITYTLNITGNTFYAHYTVCEEGVKKTACYFSKDMKNISFGSEFGDNLSQKAGVTCYWEQVNVSSSVVSVNIYISQVVKRSLSAMILSTSTSGLPKPSLLRQVEVLYPPSITSLDVDGQEVNGNYFINNSQEVNVSCYFKKGNPPAVFRLLLKNGTELISSHDEEHLHHLLTAECEDDWPMVRCEGNGTQQNRSVTFLVRCPPQFVDVSMQIYTTYARDTIELPVKAHTTLLTACFMTAVPAEDITERNMSCTLHGKPPDLRLHLDIANLTQGNWTLTLRNEIGSATATIRVLGSLNSTPSSPKAALPTNVTTALMCGFVVTFVTIVVVSIIVVRNVKRQRHEVAVMKSTSGNLQGNSSTIIVNDLIEASGEADRNNIVNSSLSIPPTSSEVPSRPLRSRLPTGDTQSDARNSSSETSENVYFSARKVREKKQLQKKDRETYVAESSHTSTNAAEMSPHPDPKKKPSCNRNADGLIYGDLIFTNTKLSKVIIGTEEKTEYTEIQVTSPRLQTDC